jgi:hypothetical protein
MLEMARAMMHGDSPITDAEARLRRLTASPKPGSEQPDKA